MTTRQYLYAHFIAKGKAARAAALAAGYSKLVLEQNLQLLSMCPRVQQKISEYGVETDEQRQNLKAQIRVCRSIMEKESASDDNRLEASRQMTRAMEKLEKLGAPMQPRQGISAAQLDSWPEWRDQEPNPEDLKEVDKQEAEKARQRAEKRAEKRLEQIKISQTMQAKDDRMKEQKQTLLSLSQIEQAVL